MSSRGATTALRDGVRERRRSEWSIPFARSLTKQTARKAVVPLGCVKIERDRAGWNSDRPDFTSNALREDLFRGS